MPAKQNPPESKGEPQDPLKLLLWFTLVYMGCFTPILHTRFGTRSLRAYVMCPVLLFFYAAFARCPELVLYMPIWFVFVVVRRCTASRQEMSYYNGYPWLTGMLVGNEYWARALEALLCIGIGVLLMPYGKPLGQFIAFGGVAMLITLGADTHAINTRIVAIEDGMKEAQQWQRIQEGGDGWGGRR